MFAGKGENVHHLSLRRKVIQVKPPRREGVMRGKKAALHDQTYPAGKKNSAEKTEGTDREVKGFSFAPGKTTAVESRSAAGKASSPTLRKKTRKQRDERKSV